MDGYEYERKVLFPMWECERLEKERTMMKSNSAGVVSKETRDRFKEKLGIELPKDPGEAEMNLSSKMLKNPDNFFPELSPDYELRMSGKKSRWA